MRRHRKLKHWSIRELKLLKKDQNEITKFVGE